MKFSRCLETGIEYCFWTVEKSRIVFPDQQEPFETGVCVGQVQKKSRQTMSTVSVHLSLLQQAGLLTSTKKGKRTYYKRNEQRITELIDLIKYEL